MTQQKQENSPKDDSTKTRKQSNMMTQQKQENSPKDDSTKTRKQSKR